MRELIRVAIVLCPLACLVSSTSAAQDLVPGAYTPGPVGFNVVTIVANINVGDITFDPSIPVEDGHATIGAGVVVYNRTLDIAGRFASVGLVAPYVQGHVEGVLLGQFHETSRSGLGDLSARVAINLVGASAMTPKQFAGYRPTTVLGVSVAVVVPVGRYDPARVINIGTNRWTLKPEAGFSRTRGRWTFEGDLGVALFTDNTNFREGGTYEQAPIVAMQGHLIYTVRPGFWLAGDGNFWSGGRATTNGVVASQRQQNSRLGATLAVPIRTRQFRISYSAGAYTTIGGSFSSVGVSYSHAWIGRP